MRHIEQGFAEGLHEFFPIGVKNGDPKINVSVKVSLVGTPD